jgi:hypothetical protein
MSSIYTNVLSNVELDYLNNHPNVLEAKTSLDSKPSGMVYFTVPINNLIRDTLQKRFGLNLSVDAQIPMRWIKGDTAPHIDTGASHFQNTYLLYLNDSPGNLILDAQSYPIQSNTGFVFNEGLYHETQYTENIPRLLLGPMNELAEPVGAPTTRYYIRLTLPDLANLVIFNGFFDVDNATNIVQFFYDSTNPSVNIRSTGNNGGPTYLYNPGWLCFDGGGCNVTSFPYLYGATQGDYNMSGNIASSTGNSVDGLSNVTYEFILTPIAYYPTEADALANTNSLGNGTSNVVGDGGPFGPGGGYTSWRLATNSTGSSPQNVVYTNGSVLNADGLYFFYPSAPCFLEGTTILCQVDGVEKYVSVEQLTKGTLVKTSLDGYKPVVLIGKGTIKNPGNDERIENRLYKCSTSKYSQLKEDLYITGCHSILEYPITEKQKEETIKQLGILYVTDKKYRLMACIDDRAEPWNSEGVYTIWHFALENSDDILNYGVYANGGLLVETCSISFLKKYSNMEYI